MSDYIQIGSTQMFWLSEFSVPYWDKSGTYMPLTLVVTSAIPDFLCIPETFSPKHYQHYKQNIHLSKRYVLSKTVFRDSWSAVPICDMVLQQMLVPVF